MLKQEQTSIPDYQLKFIKQQEIAMRKMMKSLNIDKYTHGTYIESINKANEQAKKFSQLINSSYNQHIQETIEKVLNIEIPVIPKHIVDLAESINKQSKKFQDEFKQTHPKVKESVIAMINIGWYPDIENFAMSALINFKDQLSENNISEVDDALVEYYKDSLPRTREYLVSKHPNREEILNTAFEAHTEGNYILSIPVFLAQVDGIAIDTFRKYFFIKQKGSTNPQISQAIDTMDGLSDLALAILIPLQSSQPLIYSLRERGDGFTQLNRHQVLHGESLDYGTELNSYKVISLLLYISQTANMIELKTNGEY